MAKEKVLLLLGSNLGNRELNFLRAIQLLEESVGQIHSSSRWYETAAWGKTGQPPFLNCAIQIWLEDLPENLLQKLKEIEKTVGRQPAEEIWGPRVLDIDILFFGGKIIQNTDLTIPHPRMAERRFALEPLAEIAAGHRHPILGITVREMLNNCTDPLIVKPFPVAHEV